MKITAELIQQSPQFTNPMNQRQLDLRGYKISVIENMGATLNFFQCIDLSDNEIRKVGNFSYLDKLTSLIMTNNRVKVLSELQDSLPNLENLFLMNNKIAQLTELNKLKGCKKLQRLILINNPITNVQNYRFYAIAHLPQLRILDFEKITKNQRIQAEKLFAKDPKK